MVSSSFMWLLVYVIIFRLPLMTQLWYHKVCSVECSRNGNASICGWKKFCFPNKLREMITSALRTVVKKINIEIMHWKLVKSWMFNFMKVKIVVFNENFLFLTSLTIAMRALVSKTHKLIDSRLRERFFFFQMCHVYFYI